MASSRASTPGRRRSKRSSDTSRRPNPPWPGDDNPLPPRRGHPMRHPTSLLLLLALSAGTPGHVPLSASGPDEEPARPAARSNHRYPDFGFMPPADQYEGRVFVLSQD